MNRDKQINIRLTAVELERLKELSRGIGITGWIQVQLGLSGEVSLGGLGESIGKVADENGVKCQKTQ